MSSQQPATDAATVHKLTGAPGCGKTTTLFEYLEQERRDGLALSDFYYLTFTRSGRAEAADRLRFVYADSDADPKSQARTLHSAALAAVRRTGEIPEPRDQIIDLQTDTDVYRDFCHSQGIPFEDETTDPLRLAREKNPSDTRLGNQIFAINEWLTNHRKGYEKCHASPVGLPCRKSRLYNPDTGDGLLSRWAEYKRTADGGPYYEHGDYVDIAIDRELTPGVSHLFIDEFQDLNPQEYLLFKTWRDSGALDTIYIAGDPDQSIYGFRQAEPMYFRRTPTDQQERVMASYRCPPPVVSVARGILAADGGEGALGFRSNRAGGSAEQVSLETADAVADAVTTAANEHADDAPDTDGDGTVFCLTRSNRQAGKVAWALEQGGVPYSFLGNKRYRAPWADPLPDILDAFRVAVGDRGGGVSVDAVNTLRDHLGGTHRAAFDAELPERMGDVYARKGVRAAADALGGWKAVAENLELSDTRLERLRPAVTSDAPADPSAVRVGTIHAAKGLEAPAVFLFDGYPRRLYNKYLDRKIAAEERRIYYVGVTRASETLRVVSDFIGGEVFPPFEGGLPTDSPPSSGGEP